MTSRSRFKNANRVSFLGDRRGFTLIEILMVIIIVSTLAVVSISTFDSGIEESRFDETVSELEAIRQALIGDPDATQANVRMSFGFSGDIGALPSNAQGLSAIITNPGFPAWNVNSAIRFGLGWNGPYISGGGTVASLTTDAWGRSYIYNGATNPATVTSLGADGVAGGTSFDQDITVQIPASAVAATIHGFLSASGAPYTGTATIDLNYPSAGAPAVVSTNIAAADQGHFSFTNVPLGHRSVMVYIPSKAAPTQTLGPLTFTIDRSNFLIPSELTSFTPVGGGGGGGPAPTPTPPATGCPSSVITYVAGSASMTGNTRLNFTFNVTTNVNVSAAKFTTSLASPAWNSIRLNGLTRNCNNPNLLVPCPVASAQTATLSPVVALSTGTSLSARVESPSSLVGSGTLTLELTHDLGCSILSIPVP